MADEPNNTEGTSGPTPEQGYDGGPVPPLGGNTEGTTPIGGDTPPSPGDTPPAYGQSSTPYEASSPYAPTNDYSGSTSPYDSGSTDYSGSTSSYDGSSSDYNSPTPYTGSDSYGIPSGSGDASTDASTATSEDALYESNDQVTNLSDPAPAPSVSFGKDPQTPDAEPGAPSGYGSSTDPYGSNEAPSPYGQAPQSAPAYGQQPEAQQPVSGPQYGTAPAYGGTPPYGGGGGVNPYNGAGYPAAQNKFNVFGLISLIAGGLGILLGLIPFIGVIAAFLGFAGLVLGILGLVLKNFNARKGLAIAGTIVSVIAIIVGIANPIVWTNIITSSAPTSSTDYSSTYSTYTSDYDTADRQVQVVLTVTSDGPVDIDYNISNGMYSGTDAVDKSEALFAQSSPWTTTMDMGIQTEYDGSSVSLRASTDSYDDNVSCEVTVDGIVVVQDSSKGYASCSVYGLNSYLN